MSRRLPGELPRTTMQEIAASLNMVLTRLQADPDSVEEWRIISDTLRKAANAAGQHRDARCERVGLEGRS